MSSFGSRVVEEAGADSFDPFRGIRRVVVSDWRRVRVIRLTSAVGIGNIEYWDAGGTFYFFGGFIG